MSSIVSRYSSRVPALGALPDEVSALFVLYAGPAVCAKTPSGASTGITAAKVSRPTAATVTAIMLFFLGSPAILILLVVGRAGGGSAGKPSLLIPIYSAIMGGEH